MSLEKKLEYASIGFSALGAVLATTTQQLAYLATPVTLALILSSSNRQKEIVKANTRMAKLELSVLDYIQPNLNEFRTLQSSTSNLPNSSILNNLNGNVTNNQQEIGKLKTELVEIKQKNTEIISDSNELHTLVNSIEVEFTNAKSKIDSAVETSRHLSGINSNWIDTLNSSLADLNNFKLGMDNKIVEVVDTIVSDRNIEKSINQSISKQFEVIKRILPKQYSYDLVCGRLESRNIFIDALKQSKKSLFLVCPWITNYAINSDIKQQIESALRRGVSTAVSRFMKDNNSSEQTSYEDAENPLTSWLS